MIKDSNEMIEKYGFDEFIAAADAETKKKFLEFRLSLLTEEYREVIDAFNNNDAEELVDGLIDVMVIAIGTLNMYGVDVQRAWDVVHKANMSKVAGLKEGRPNPHGYPDMSKPDDWVAPSHQDNHGKLHEIAYTP